MTVSESHLPSCSSQEGRRGGGGRGGKGGNRRLKKKRTIARETGTKHLDPLIANDLPTQYFYNLHFLLWVGRGDAHSKKHIWRLEANLRESIFSFHHANSSKHFDLLNHLKGTNDLCDYFILNCFCNYLHRKLYAPLLKTV